MARLLAGLDLGTSGIRLGVFDCDGRVVAWEQRAFAAATGTDAEEWYSLTVDSLRAVRDLPISAVGVGGQGPTLVAADEALRPVAPAVSWSDQRPNVYAGRLGSLLGRDVRESIVPKAVWLQEHAPEAFERARWLFSAWDYVASRLVGSAVSLLEMPRDLILASGLAAELFPAYCAPPSVVGRWMGMYVIGCYVDSFNGVIGTGVRGPGQGCLNCGTSGTVTIVCPREQATISLHGQPAVSRLLSSTGNVLSWLARTTGASIEQLLVEAEDSPPGADGVVCVPYVAGGRPPLIAPGAEASFAGLRIEHTRADLTRAALEGSAFTFKVAVDDLIRAGVRIDELRVCGGQARSHLWNEIKASVLDRALYVPTVVDAAALGCAMLGGLATDAFNDLDHASARMVRVKDTVLPRWDYAAAYERWRRTARLDFGPA